MTVQKNKIKRKNSQNKTKEKKLLLSFFTFFQTKCLSYYPHGYLWLYFDKFEPRTSPSPVHGGAAEKT